MNNSLFGANYNLGGTFQPFPHAGQSFTSDPLTSPSKYAPVLQTTVDRNQALQPVSLTQLVHATQEHPDDAFHINNTPLRNVTFVGYIVKVDELSTNLCYQIEDGTANMEVRLYMLDNDSEQQAQKRAALQPGVWVRVFGSLREFNGERSVKAHHIQPVDDMNEILFHRLQVIQVYLQQTRGVSNKNKQTLNNNVANGTRGEYFDQGTDIMNDSSFSPIHQSVLATIRHLSKDYRGTSDEEIVANLKQKFPPKDIHEAIHFLMEEGHIYTTIDESHYQACSSF
jgi:replication factor A2